MSAMPNFFYQFQFYLFGLIAIASAIVFVTRRSPVAAALWLVLTMFCLAALYVMLEAHFVGVIQVLVYAGAIMVVFLFVVMLLNLGQPSELSDLRGKWGRLVAGLLGLALIAQLWAVTGPEFRSSLLQPADHITTELRERGAVGAVAQPLFAEHLLAFELTSVLLLVAIVGAVVVGRRRGLR
ncbi:MAG TPA: NADH-quinone oxidoreductase subunit J [Gemmatimonadaceae bacterium]|nr:NADH-quinone oxidoreductase subunit J [Gemmatimonadaceae bacterium]